MWVCKSQDSNILVEDMILRVVELKKFRVAMHMCRVKENYNRDYNKNTQMTHMKAKYQ